MPVGDGLRFSQLGVAVRRSRTYTKWSQSLEKSLLLPHIPCMKRLAGEGHCAEPLPGSSRES